MTGSAFALRIRVAWIDTHFRLPPGSPAPPPLPRPTVMRPCCPMVYQRSLPSHAGLEDIVLPARLPDADAEAGQLAVPVDGIGAVGLEGLDGAPGEFWDAVCHGSNLLTPGEPSSKLANYWQTFCIVLQSSGVAGCRGQQSIIQAISVIYRSTEAVVEKGSRS